MVRNTVFSRNDVIQAGLAVVAKDGLGALSARRVAEEMGASTAPVYSNFANMDELAIAIKKEVTCQLLEFANRHFTDDKFLNFGIGVLEFARSHPGLYSAVFLQHDERCEAGPLIMNELEQCMMQSPDLAAVSPGELSFLMHQMGIFTHGLAVRICTGMSDEHSFDDMLVFLADAGAAMKARVLSEPKRSRKQRKLMDKLMSHKQEG